MLLNLLNLYSLIFALFSKIEGMSKDLDDLKPTVNLNATMISESTLTLSEALALNIPITCFEVPISCSPCNVPLTTPVNIQYTNRDQSSITRKPRIKHITKLKLFDKAAAIFPTTKSTILENKPPDLGTTQKVSDALAKKLQAQNLMERDINENDTTTENYENEETLLTMEYSSLTSDIFTVENYSTSTDNINNDRSDVNTTELTQNFTETDIDEEIYSTMEYINNDTTTTTESSISLLMKELERLRQMSLSKFNNNNSIEDTSSEVGDDDYTFEEFTTDITSSSSNETTLNYVDHDNFSTTDTTKEYIISTKESTSSNSGSETKTHSMDTNVTELYYTDVSSDSTEYTTSSSADPSNDKSITELPVTRPIVNTGIISTKDYSEPKSTLKDENEAFSTTTYIDSTISTIEYTEDASSDLTTISSVKAFTVCPNISFNCSVICGGENITQVFYMSNCTAVQQKCYTTQCMIAETHNKNSSFDLVYEDEHKRRMYNLTIKTKKKLLKLCWETMFGQELVKLTMMDLVRHSTFRTVILSNHFITLFL